MWLLDTITTQLVFFVNPPARYAILSHTWEDDEVIFQDMANLDVAQKKAGWTKIARVCDQAKADYYGYVWVDTCCIDKSSSAELSESINSMFTWYKESSICYVYLADFHHGADYLAAETPPPDLVQSRWFTRGWTLQELIAPKDILFFNSHWAPVGDKSSMASKLKCITGIDESILEDGMRIHSVCVARRMFWAAKRQTTRLEDEAYCLLGIFGINLPLLYGEGSRAFLRLQEAICQEHADLSIFAWSQEDEEPKFRGIFATCPREFASCGNIRPMGGAFRLRRGFEIAQGTVRIAAEDERSHGLATRIDLECYIDPTTSLITHLAGYRDLTHLAGHRASVGISLQKFGQLFFRRNPHHLSTRRVAQSREVQLTTVSVVKTVSPQESSFIQRILNSVIQIRYDDIVGKARLSLNLNIKLRGDDDRDITVPSVLPNRSQHATSFIPSATTYPFVFRHGFNMTVSSQKEYFTVMCGYQPNPLGEDESVWYALFRPSTSGLSNLKLPDSSDGNVPTQLASEVVYRYGDFTGRIIQDNLPTSWGFWHHNIKCKVYLKKSSRDWSHYEVREGVEEHYIDVCYDEENFTEYI